MSDRFCQFVDSHPEFFELCHDYWRLQKDISSLMERYAHAFNREEYEQLRAHIETLRQKECQRLQEIIQDLFVQRRREEAKIQEVDAELRKIDSQIHALEVRLAKLKKAHEPKSSPRRHWYHSGWTYLLLAIFGVTFLYLGIILNKAISPSYVIAGVICIAAGFYLQGGPRTHAAAQNDNSAQIAQLREEERRFKQISRIKKATLMEVKKVALKNVSHLNEHIEGNYAKIRELNG